MCADKEETDKTSDNSAELSVLHTTFLYLTSDISHFTFQISHRPSSIFHLLLLPVVVYHLDGEDNHTTSERDEVGE